jgi:hypothetical protein
VVGSDQLVIGTASLGDDYGDVIKATVKVDSDKQEVMAPNGNLRALIFSNMRKEITLETRFDADVPCPQFGDVLALPGIGVQGFITSATVSYDRGKERTLSISATQWDALKGATAYTLNTATGIFA